MEKDLEIEKVPIKKKLWISIHGQIVTSFTIIVLHSHPIEF